MADPVPEEEIARRFNVLNERQRALQIRRNSQFIGRVEEVNVEGRNHALGQWIGRTSQNRTLNFSHPSEDAGLVGQYLPVRVLRAGPNSLVGEALAG